LIGKFKRHKGGKIMTKEKEIEIITNAALELGKDSYLGKWLVNEIPFLRHSIEQDFYPIGIGESERIAHKTISDAEKHACDLLRDAEKRANKILENAENEIRIKKKLAYDRMRDILSDIQL